MSNNNAPAMYSPAWFDQQRRLNQAIAEKGDVDKDGLPDSEGKRTGSGLGFSFTGIVMGGDDVLTLADQTTHYAGTVPHFDFVENLQTLFCSEAKVVDFDGTGNQIQLSSIGLSMGLKQITASLTLNYELSAATDLEVIPTFKLENSSASEETKNTTVYHKHLPLTDSGSNDITIDMPITYNDDLEKITFSALLKSPVDLKVKVLNIKIKIEAV
ncbi:hypothetical protein [Vibrio phage BONAISHI]|nr:hypothetical protein [Vibrio phage BONAISHI]